MNNSSTINNWGKAAPAKSFSEQLQRHVDHAKGLYMAWRKENPNATNVTVFKHVMLGYLSRVALFEGDFEQALARIKTFWEEYQFNYIEVWEKEYQASLESKVLWTT